MTIGASTENGGGQASVSHLSSLTLTHHSTLHQVTLVWYECTLLRVGDGFLTNESFNKTIDFRTL